MLLTTGQYGGAFHAVPWLTAQGLAPDSAQPYRASLFLASALPAGLAKKFTLLHNSVNLIGSFALPRSTFPELAVLRQDDTAETE